MRLYVHGTIASMIASQVPHWKIDSNELFSQKIIDEIDRYHELVATADVIISQPIHNGYRERQDLSLGWIRTAAKATAVVISIVYVYRWSIAGWGGHSALRDMACLITMGYYFTM